MLPGVYDLEVSATDTHGIVASTTFSFALDPSVATDGMNWTGENPFPPAIAVTGGHGTTATGKAALTPVYDSDQEGFDVALPDDLQVQVSSDSGQTWTDVPGDGAFTPTIAGTYIMRARVRDAALGDANTAPWSHWSPITDASVEIYDPALNS